jgi:hypothetical protein
MQGVAHQQEDTGGPQCLCDSLLAPTLSLSYPKLRGKVVLGKNVPLSAS